MVCMTSDEISTVLRALGLEHSHVWGFADCAVMHVRLNEGDCTYETIARVASRFGTTNISFRYTHEYEPSEVTFDPSSAELVITLPNGQTWDAMPGEGQA